MLGVPVGSGVVTADDAAHAVLVGVVTGRRVTEVPAGVGCALLGVPVAVVEPPVDSSACPHAAAAQAGPPSSQEHVRVGPSHQVSPVRYTVPVSAK